MKRNLIIAIASIFVLTSCNKQKETLKTDYSRADIAVLVDVTDYESYRLDARKLFDGIGKESFYEETNVYIQTISDYRINPISQYSLGRQNFWLSNYHKRKKKAQTFYESIDTVLTTLYKNQSEKSRSNIFVPMIKMANMLTESPAAIRNLIVVSDLAENRADFQSYSPYFLKLIKTNPDAAEKLILGNTQIGDYRNMTIILVHSSRNLSDDDLYIVMLSFATRIFERHGAKVLTGINV